jgi:hypothetical protein
MIGAVRIVTFDTSAHNRVVDDGPRSKPILAGINSELWFRFAGLSVEELFACSKPEERDALFTSCRRLQRGPSECLLASNLLIEQLILGYFNDPKTFDWKMVNVRWSDCERAIRNPEFFADEHVSKEQRELQRERRMLGQQQRERQRVSLRPVVQAIFKKHGEEPPATFPPAISRLENVEGSSVWVGAQRFYDRVTRTDSDEATVKEFMSVCPPFRALVYAMFIPWYDTAVRDYSVADRLNAGSNDLFMSVYLPYCDWFVTDDPGQEKALREVALAAGLETEILSYDDFCNSFLVTA